MSKKCVYCAKEHSRPRSKFCCKTCYSLDYYYRNRDIVLPKQIARWSKKYKENVDFRKKRQLRDKTRWEHNKQTKIIGICSVCSAKKDLQRHHPSYNSTDFVIVCRSCHINLHKK